mgnify:CR=1 FL=1
MTKRKHQLLTESERGQILAIPTDRDHLARLYTFEPADIEIIGARRERSRSGDVGGSRPAGRVGVSSRRYPPS